MEIVFIWIIGSIIVAVAAKARGRSPVAWLALSVLLSPLLMLVLVLVMGKASDHGTPERATPDTHVRCPDCRELVMRDARKCKHCGTALIPQ